MNVASAARAGAENSNAAAKTAARVNKTGIPDINSRQGESFQIEGTTIAPAKHNSMLSVQAIQLIDALPGFDRLITNALLVVDLIRNAFCFFDTVGIDLHDAAAAVREQQIIFAIFLVNDHIDRTISVAEFSNRLALDLRTGLEVAQRELDQGRARVSGEQMRFVANLKRHERADR